ncbi:MAG: 3-dehydroquinate synthase [Ruminococcaceae bacterium]|nr:3-dehydroquinate synthase [Oscillospiraceae bacterium]
MTNHITVNASKTYTVSVERGILARAGERIAAILPPPRRLLLVSDDTVDSLWGNTLLLSLESVGFTVCRFTFLHGESSKNTDTLCRLWNAAAQAGLSRSDAIVALGGGVTGDLAGFAAATYLRGIACVQIPTTLLAMVDSSVGGKTAVDLPSGKNLCGAFFQPSLVLCDTEVLHTLPAEYFTDGCAEVIKYGYIGDPLLLDLLKKPFADSPEQIIARCVAQKRDLVEADEQDTGVRQLLNLGHTGGHAVERLSDFSVSHGRAVAIGMLLAARAATARGICTPDVAPHMQDMLMRYGLPTDCLFSATELAEAALADKKRRGDEITLALPTSLGKSELVKLPTDGLADFFAAGGARR